MKTIEVMRVGPVIPVIIIDRIELEVTLRTAHGLEAIRRMSKVKDAIVGVGTISRPEDFDAAKAAGAVFGVSPGLTPALIEAQKKCGLPLLPGTMTPSDIITARAAGFTELKLFPAQQAGGIGMLKAMGSVFSDVMFCPTGGVTQQTAPDFLALPNVACVGGSWLTPKDAIAKGDWQTITELARAASALRK